MLGHNFDKAAGTVTRDATCTTSGVKTYKCTRCAAIAEEEIPINTDAHTWDAGTVTTAPTCSAEGVLTYTCLNDNTHHDTAVIPKDPDAHAWTDGVVTKEATCSAKGEITYTCSLCSDTKTEETAENSAAHKMERVDNYAGNVHDGRETRARL